MRRIILVILATALAVLLVACSKTENTSTSNSNTSTTAEKSMATPGTTTASTASASDKIGVAECDDFIAKYETCVSGKVPEMARAQYQNMLKTWKTEWKKLADNPQTKGTLTSVCKQAAEQQEAVLKSFGCTF